MLSTKQILDSPFRSIQTRPPKLFLSECPSITGMGLRPHNVITVIHLDPFYSIKLELYRFYFGKNLDNNYFAQQVYFF